MKNKNIGRIVDIHEDQVTFLFGSDTITVDWTEKVSPELGDVYHITVDPLTVIEKLASAQSGVDWPNSDALRWRKPDENGVQRMHLLRQRHIIKRSLRDYLHEQHFIEIDMPLLVRGTTPDAALDSFSVEDRYLVTSCEYQIKRMEVGGFDRCYTLTQNYRKGDRSPMHNPEFTMLEWARVGQSLDDIEQDVEKFVLQAHQKLGGSGVLSYQGHSIDLKAPWDRMTIREAIERYIGVSIFDFSAQSLLRVSEKAGLSIYDSWKSDDVFLFSLIFEHLQTMLGFEKPVFIHEWPKRMTASADIDATNSFAQRSELFIAGVELSDGFPTLTDYARQKEGLVEQNVRRNDAVDIDQRFLSAVREGLPSGAGMALGFDRLVMVLTNQNTIDRVLAFTWDEL